MAHSYPEPTGTRYGVLLIGAGIALCAFALGWLARFWVAPSEPADTGRVGTPTAHPVTPTGQATVSGPQDDLLADCQQVYAAQEQPLTTGAASMTQWTAHIVAMNQLVAGKITLDQATAYWNKTRVGAQARLQAYAAAANSYDARTVRCPHTVPAEDTTLSTCAHAVGARNHELSTLRRALDTWRTHVRHMEMLRLGEMSPSRAIKLWVANWHQGQSEVRAYRTAVKDAQGLAC